MVHKDIRYPLLTNKIRRGLKNHTFGMVRDGGTKAHQGWDLYASIGTPCFAVGDGEVVAARVSGTFGNVVDIRLDTKINSEPIFARYAHLNSFIVKLHQTVKKSELIGYTGKTGSPAKGMTGEDLHLHFELMRIAEPGFAQTGLSQRYNPADIYGCTPLNSAVTETL